MADSRAEPRAAALLQPLHALAKGLLHGPGTFRAAKAAQRVRKRLFFGLCFAGGVPRAPDKPQIGPSGSVPLSVVDEQSSRLDTETGS